jgi:hypothetical protein
LAKLGASGKVATSLVSAMSSASAMANAGAKSLSDISANGAIANRVVHGFNNGFVIKSPF